MGTGCLGLACSPALVHEVVHTGHEFIQNCRVWSHNRWRAAHYDFRYV